MNKLPLNKEAVIVDDCSSDGTANVVKRLSNEYGNVKLWHGEYPDNTAGKVRELLKETAS